jgi:amino acid adenylation domain-containing protein
MVQRFDERLGEASSLPYWSSVIQDIYQLTSRRPEALAVTDGELEWTYGDLRERSDSIAALLADRGIARGSVVGMHLPRCADAIAVMLGIMASGCVYLPLDPSYPAARLRFMLDQAGAAAVISDAAISGSGDSDLSGPHRTCVELPGPLASAPETRPDDLALRPEDHAYILFTSGSTGQPKGVMVTHRNISLMNEWSAHFLGITEADSSATSCSLSFDASFHEVLLPLSAGGTVHVIPHALALGQLVRPVSLTATTPTVASELLRAGQLPPIKALIVGGEALTPDVAERLLASGRVGRLLNGYGPTECTVCVSMAEVTAPVPGVISIGRPVPGTEILILGPGGERLPDGERGEICVFGGQVTDGYVNDPAGTAERFLVGPEAAAGGRRYYRTGDLGYRADDGSFYFAGRADRQVKLNGIRIELGEIDTALRSHPQVAEAATVVRDSARAVAYIVPAQPGADLDLAGLRDFLADHLPRFMIPAGIVVLPELPKTVNGKLDTAALPEWSPGRPVTGEGLAPGRYDEDTARVIEIVARVTGFVGQVSPSDDFINDLGGTSLGVVQVLTELERQFGRRLRLNEALADTSVAGLAGLLRDAATVSPADFAFNTDGDAPPLFLVQAYLGAMLGLRRLAELLPPEQPAYGLYVPGDGSLGYGPASDQLAVSALAGDVLSRVRAIAPSGPVVLAGHSVGGLIVLEAARKMLEAGDAEPRVVLVDTTRPYGVLGYYWGESVMLWRQLPRIAAERLLTAASKPFRRATQAPAPAGPRPDAGDPADVMAVNARTMQPVSAQKRYRVAPYDGKVTVMRTRQGWLIAMGRRTLGWSSVTRGTPDIIPVPGSHVSILRPPHVQVVARRLADLLSVSRPGRGCAPGPAAPDGAADPAPAHRS